MGSGPMESDLLIYCRVYFFLCKAILGNRQKLKGTFFSTIVVSGIRITVDPYINS